MRPGRFQPAGTRAARSPAVPAPGGVVARVPVLVLSHRPKETEMTTTTVPPRLRVAHAITLKNPWAHLIAHYGKDVENRTWMPWDDVNTLLIHAGKGWDRGPEFTQRTDVGEPHTSAIVAVADLAFACNTSRYSDTVRCGCGEWAMAGQCHWKLANVRALREPVPANGRQGLWRPSPDDLARVAEALSHTV